MVGTALKWSGLFDRTAGDSFTAIGLWWVWRSWLARQIVALEALGSSPSTHPIGLSPSGKATAFDAVIRWFESS